MNPNNQENLSPPLEWIKVAEKVNIQEAGEQKLQGSNTNRNARWVYTALASLPVLDNGIQNAATQFKFITAEFSGNTTAEAFGLFFSACAFISCTLLYGTATLKRFVEFSFKNEDLAEEFKALAGWAQEFKLLGEPKTERDSSEDPFIKFIKPLFHLRRIARWEHDLAQMIVKSPTLAAEREEKLEKKLLDSVQEKDDIFMQDYQTALATLQQPSTAPNLNNNDASLESRRSTSDEKSNLLTVNLDLVKRAAIFQKISDFATTVVTNNFDSVPEIDMNLRKKIIQKILQAISRMRFKANRQFEYTYTPSEIKENLLASETRQLVSELSALLPPGKINTSKETSLKGILEFFLVQEIKNEEAARSEAKKLFSNHPIYDRAYKEQRRKERIDTDKSTLSKSTALTDGTWEHLLHNTGNAVGCIGAVGNGFMVTVGTEAFLDKICHLPPDHPIALWLMAFSFISGIIASGCFTRRFVRDNFAAVGADIDRNNFNSKDFFNTLWQRKTLIVLLKSLTSGVCAYMGAHNVVDLFTDICSIPVSSNNRILPLIEGLLGILAGISTLFSAGCLYYDNMRTLTKEKQGRAQINIEKNGAQWSAGSVFGLALAVCISFAAATADFNTIFTFQNLNQIIENSISDPKMMDLWYLTAGIFACAGFLCIFSLNVNKLSETTACKANLFFNSSYHHRPLTTTETSLTRLLTQN